MARAIVIPLYDHTPDDEIREIMAELDRLQFSIRPIVVGGYVTPPRAEELRGDTDAIAGRPGWRVDRAGQEWYSAAWLDEAAV